jgi:hypothetical protein
MSSGILCVLRRLACSPQALAFITNAFPNEAMDRVCIEAWMPRLGNAYRLQIKRHRECLQSQQRQCCSRVMFRYGGHHIGAGNCHKRGIERRHNYRYATLQSKFFQRIIDWPPLNSSPRSGDMVLFRESFCGDFASCKRMPWPHNSYDVIHGEMLNLHLWSVEFHVSLDIQINGALPERANSFTAE